VPDEEEKTPIPRWEFIDEIANKMEKLFFEESTKKELSPYEMSVILNRVVLLFDEYKMLLMSQHSIDQRPNVDFKGSNIYK